jgi:four helix bundle protein
VWQRAVDLAVQVHPLTRGMSREHRFSLAEQVNRAAVSVTSNVAEGAGRFGRGEFRRHVSIALGSVRELETQLLLGLRIEAFAPGQVAEPLALAEEVGRMLTKLGNRLQ